MHVLRERHKQNQTKETKIKHKQNQTTKTKTKTKKEERNEKKTRKGRKERQIKVKNPRPVAYLLKSRQHFKPLVALLLRLLL
jgi:hypothetical protein